MSRQAGLDVLARLQAADPEYWRAIIQPRLADIVPPDRKQLGELQRRMPGDDPDELLRDRFLCRGGTLLFAGPTGVGKSSLTMQCLIKWAVGQDLFGIRPARPLRSLLVQAENDEGDLAEMRDGVLHGLDLTAEQTDLAMSSIEVISEDAKSGEAFAAFLDAALTERRPDLVVVDPVFSYLGGDASAQKVVTPWLRNQLLPLVHRHHVGLVLVHHTNKPKSGEEKGAWAASELAYLGAGSAEWANFARAILALRAIGSSTVFELVAGKRGRRLGWTDETGKHTDVKHVAHALEPGRIFWRRPAPDEVAAEGITTEMDDIRRILAVVYGLIRDNGDCTQADVAKELKGDMAPGTLKKRIPSAIRLGYLESSSVTQDRRKKGLSITDKGKSALGADL